MDATDIIAVYGAVVATTVFAFELWKWVNSERRSKTERSKIRVYFGVTIIKREVRHFGTFHVFPLCVSNLGREPTIIADVEVHYEKGSFHPGAYNEPEATLGVKSPRMLPRLLQPGETLELEQFTFATFRQKPVSVAAVDSDSRKYLMPEETLKRQIEEVRRARARYEEQRKMGDS